MLTSPLGDVAGSLDAIDHVISGIKTSRAVVEVVSKGISPLIESDILYAKSVNGTLSCMSLHCQAERSHEPRSSCNL